MLACINGKKTPLFNILKFHKPIHKLKIKNIFLSEIEQKTGGSQTMKSADKLEAYFLELRRNETYKHVSDEVLLQVAMEMIKTDVLEVKLYSIADNILI